MAMLIILALSLAFLFWQFGRPVAREIGRQRLRARPFPASWRQILRLRVPYFRNMPSDLQLQLKRHITVFLAEKPFIGCNGLQLTEEMRVTIAAQACLLIMNRRRPGYFPKLREILVYPGPFVVERPVGEASGLIHEQRRVLSGESWSSGQVILSWPDVIAGATTPDDGRNVVIHEFAHQLDQEKGIATGAPLLPRFRDYRDWSRILAAEFAQLQQAARTGQATLLDHYGATDPAEFFAVASEVFFERSAEMAADRPALYAQLCRYYRLNPLSW